MKTIDLTDEQLNYLRALVSADVAGNQRIVRSREFANYGPDESARLHADIAVGSQCIAVLPQPRPALAELSIFHRKQAS